MIADATLSVSDYKGAKSFKIDELIPTSDVSLTINDFIKVPPVDLDLMYDEICSLIKSSANDYEGKFIPLAELVLQILSEHKSSYMSSSAAVSMHHNLKGGLLYHSYRMVKAADVLCAVYTSLDRRSLLSYFCISKVNAPSVPTFSFKVLTYLLQKISISFFVAVTRVST